MLPQALLTALLVAGSSNLPAARTTYSKCLGSFVRAEVKERTAAEVFATKLGSACKAEEETFRAASIASDLAAKIPRSAAESNFSDELAYIRENAVETFKNATEPAAPR